MTWEVRVQRKAGVVLGYVNIGVKNLVNLAYTPLLLAFVSQGEYGVFEMANSFVYSFTLLSLGLTGSYVRFYAQRATRGDEAAVRRLNGRYLLLYGAMSLVMFAGGLVFSANAETIFSGSFTVDEVELASRVVAIMGASMALTLFSNVFNGYVAALERFGFQQLCQLFTTLAAPILSLALLGMGFGVVGVAYAQLVVNAVQLVLNVIYCRCAGMRFCMREREEGLFKALLVFSGWILLNQICNMLNNGVPSIVLGAVAGSATVAVFSVAVKIRALFMSLATALTNVFMPRANQIVAESNDDVELTRLMTRAGRYLAMVLFYVYGIFVVVGRWFVKVWAGADYAEAYGLALVMVASLLVPLCQNLGIEIQRAKNMHLARSVLFALTPLADCALTVLLAPRIGCWSAAVAYALTMFIGNWLWMNWYYHRRVGLDMRFFWRAVLPIAGVAVVAMAICLMGTVAFPVKGVLGCLGWVGMYTLVFGVGLWLGALTSDERAMLLRSRTTTRG